MNQVTLCDNPFEPKTWQTVKNVADVPAFLVAHFGTWPDNAHVYLDYVAESADVTPHDEATTERLGELKGHFYVVVYPEGPVLIIVIVALVVAAIAIGLAFLLRPTNPKVGDTTSSNNQLANRQNTARPNERIPDIFGQLRAVPDLIAVPYRIFINNEEIEYCYMCLGRGSYDITQIREDVTDVEEIDGTSVAIYGPNTSPNSGDAPQLLIGPAIGVPVVNLQVFSAVNGQILRAPNMQFFGNDNVNFIWPDQIGLNDSSDFTNFFAPTDLTVEHYVKIGGRDTNDDSATDPGGVIPSTHVPGVYKILDVEASLMTLESPDTVNANWDIINDFLGHASTYRSINLFATDATGNSFDTNWTDPLQMIFPDMTELWCNFVCPSGCYFIDASGNQFAGFDTIRTEISMIDNFGVVQPSTAFTQDATVDGSTVDRVYIGTTVKIAIPASWEGMSGISVRCRRVNVEITNKGFTVVDQCQWRDAFIISAISPITDNVVQIPVLNSAGDTNVGDFIALHVDHRVLRASPATTLGVTLNGAQGQASFKMSKLVALRIDPITNNVYDVTVMDTNVVIVANSQYVSPVVSLLLDGTYDLMICACNDPSSIPSVDTGISYLDCVAAGISSTFGPNPIPVSVSNNFSGDPTTFAQVAWNGIGAGVAVLADELYWRMFADCTLIFPHSLTAPIAFGDVTTVQTKTMPTQDALAQKTRKLSMLATRKLPRFSEATQTFSIELYGTTNAADIICAMALDPFIGNRSLTELDLSDIYAVLGENGISQRYFHAFPDPTVVTQFSYTFDDSKVSFEESLTDVATAVFCVAFRRGNVISVNLEQLTENSTLLFNHRNKIPKSETRTVMFGALNDNDGVTLDYIEPNAPNYPQIDTTVSLYFPADQSAKNPKKITSIGIRNAKQALTLGWRIYNKILYQNTNVQFDATQEAALSVIQDRILVADNTRWDTQDGEVIDQVSLLLTLSQNVIFKVGLTYTIFLQHPDQTVESIGITAGPDSNQVILATAPTIPCVINDQMFAKTTYVIVSNAPTRSNAFLLAEKTPKAGMQYEIKAVNYDDRYYANDNDMDQIFRIVGGFGNYSRFTVPGNPIVFSSGPSQFAFPLVIPVAPGLNFTIKLVSRAGGLRANVPSGYIMYCWGYDNGIAGPTPTLYGAEFTSPSIGDGSETSGVVPAVDHGHDIEYLLIGYPWSNGISILTMTDAEIAALGTWTVEVIINQ